MLTRDQMRGVAASGQGAMPGGLDKDLSIAIRNLASNMPLTRAKGLQALVRYYQAALDAVTHEAIKAQVTAARAGRTVIDFDALDSREQKKLRQLTRRMRAEKAVKGSTWREIGPALGMSPMQALRRYGP